MYMGFLKNIVRVCLKLFLIGIICFNLFAEEDVEKQGVPSVIVLSPLSVKDYLVTPGDVYRLSYVVYNSPVVFDIAIDTSYNVRVSNLAVINIEGKTYIEFKKIVESIVIKNYPMTAVQFSLVHQGAFSVFVRGEVKTAYEHKAGALTRLSDIIQDCLTPYSSTRDIKITSANGKTKTYDLFKATRDGQLKENPYVRPGDVIEIGRAERFISIEGSIERPGTYEILKDENIDAMITVYGHGLTQSADLSSLTVYRGADSASFPLGNVFFLDTEEKQNEFILENGDRIVINNKSSRKPVIYFEGALNISEEKILDSVTKDDKKIKDINNINNINDTDKSTIIPVQFTPGDDLVSMIRSRRSWFSPKSDTYNAYLVRSGKKIPINLNKIFYDINYNEFIEVLPEDKLVVPFLEQYVTVSGAVISPGRYPYVPDRTWEYYVSLAGGFDTNRNDWGSVVITNVYGKKMNKKDVILPETTITARVNSFSYFFNKYSPIITVSASVITAVLAILTFISRK